MKIVVIVICCLVLLLGLFYLITIVNRPKREDYAHLMKPRITTLDSRLSLVVNFEGDADKVLKEAFGKLFSSYYRVKGVPKGQQQPPSMARYEGFDTILELSQKNIKDMPWKGFVSIPVPKNTQFKNSDDVKLEIVDYGLVAELVHFGPYDQEMENIERLKDFINKEGYKIIGLHEEQYILGPGFLYVNPKNYITIIRYQISKK